MAITSGHGNPNWTREEVVLALELYFECRERVPSANDPRVRALSEVLRAFPHHSLAARKESFRNPDGVAFKLQNLRQVDTGKGLGNVSKIDREVWDEFAATPDKLKGLAALIRAGISTLYHAREDSAEYEVFAEGRVVTETHIRRERNSKLRVQLIEKRRMDNRLNCELCERLPRGLSKIVEDAIFEAHHIVPLSAGEARNTKLSEMALLCACCHRLIHRAIAAQGKWLSLEEAKKVIYELG